MHSTKKPRATASMKLAVMLSKQAAFNNKIAALKRAVTEAAEADVTALKLKFSKLAQEFGILTLSDSVLRKAFVEIAKANGCSPVPTIPQGEVKAVLAPEMVKPVEPVYVVPAAPASVAPRKVEEIKKGGMFSR